jgi:hypothetical protein
MKLYSITLLPRSSLNLRENYLQISINSLKLKMYS